MKNAIQLLAEVPHSAPERGEADSLMRLTYKRLRERQEGVISENQAEDDKKPEAEAERISRREQQKGVATQKQLEKKKITAIISLANPNWIAANTEADLFVVAYMVNNRFSEDDMERQLLRTGNYFLVKSGTQVEVLGKNSKKTMVQVRLPDGREGWLPSQAVPIK
jgi:hypothetical protein